MDAHRFNDIVRSLTTGGASRRGITRALAALSLTGTLSPLVGLATAYAKKKKRKKKKKVTFNDFGCVNVGSFCTDDGQCCSGICQGKKGKKGKKDKRRCAAHDVDDCPAGADSCLAGLDLCTNGFCYQTTGGASFCAGGGVCHDCTRDTDCEPVFGEGAACAVCPVCMAGTSCLSVAYPGNREPRR
jgi:hypothetical protein